MDLAKHVDDRMLEFEYGTAAFQLGGFPITSEAVRVLDAAGELQWHDAVTRQEWLVWIAATVRPENVQPVSTTVETTASAQPGVVRRALDRVDTWMGVTRRERILILVSAALLLAMMWVQAGSLGFLALVVLSPAVCFGAIIWAARRTIGWERAEAGDMRRAFILTSTVGMLASVVLGFVVAEGMLRVVVVAPIVEEFAKAIIALVIVRQTAPSLQRWPFVLLTFAAAGLGFSFAEAALYMSSAVPEGVGVVLVSLVVRGVLFWVNHSVYAGITGLGVAIGMSHTKWRRVAGPVGLVLAIATHAAFNSTVQSAARGWLMGLVIVPLAIVAVLALRRSLRRRPEPLSTPVHADGVGDPLTAES